MVKLSRTSLIFLTLGVFAGLGLTTVLTAVLTKRVLGAAGFVWVDLTGAFVLDFTANGLLGLGSVLAMVVI
jgi:hypothetical protein